MIFVVIYHLFCAVGNPFGPLNVGYVGVDIFLFLSGYGLSASYTKNSISKFYKNRIVKIYPIYFISVCCAILLNDWGIREIFFNITTIGYYIDGGVHRFDWYLESLFGIYAIFPLFYIIFERGGIKSLLLFTVIVGFGLYYFDIAWWYDCLIARLPIFILGILFCKSTAYRPIYLWIGLLLYLPCRILISQFFAAQLLAIPLIVTSINAIPYLNNKCISCISHLGKHSLEIYAANVLVLNILRFIDDNLQEFLLYWILQIVLSLLLINLNKKVLALINKQSVINHRKDPI